MHAIKGSIFLKIYFKHYSARNDSDYNFCNQYRARPACTSIQSDQGSILLADQLQVLILGSLKMIIENSKNRRWIISFKKFSRLWVKHILIYRMNISTNDSTKSFETISFKLYRCLVYSWY